MRTLSESRIFAELGGSKCMDSFDLGRGLC